MTGARQFVCDERYLYFRIGRNKCGANLVKIALNGLDLYDMTFERVQVSQKTLETKRKTISEHNDVYADQLQSVFTQVTGLHTHL